MNNMRLIRIAIAVTVIVFGLCASGQSTAKMKKIIIADGYFFDEMPVSQALIEGMLLIETENGTKAVGLMLTEPLPDAVLKYAFPKDSVPEADTLLAQYHDNRSEAIPITFTCEPLLKAGDKFPKFSATGIDGKKWINKDVEGKVMVLNCWFTGCGPCRTEMPELSTWKEEMPDVLFFSSTYEDAATARSVLESRNFTWTALVNDKVFTKYIGSNGYPLTVVVGKDGIIRHVEYGTSLMQRDAIKAAIQALR